MKERRRLDGINSIAQNDIVTLSPYVYPLLPGGGLFLLILGIFLLVGGALQHLQKLLLVAGFVFAGVAMAVLAARLSAPFGIPSKVQVLSLIVAILLEMVVIAIVRRRLSNSPERTITLAILAVVATHFFIMIPAFGPVIALLGIVCLLNVRRGFGHRGNAKCDAAIRSIWMTDALLKTLAGALMLAVTHWARIHPSVHALTVFTTPSLRAITAG